MTLLKFSIYKGSIFDAALVGGVVSWLPTQFLWFWVLDPGSAILSCKINGWHPKLFEIWGYWRAYLKIDHWRLWWFLIQRRGNYRIHMEAFSFFVDYFVWTWIFYMHVLCAIQYHLFIINTIWLIYYWN